MFIYSCDVFFVFNLNVSNVVKKILFIFWHYGRVVRMLAFRVLGSNTTFVDLSGRWLLDIIYLGRAMLACSAFGMCLKTIPTVDSSLLSENR